MNRFVALMHRYCYDYTNRQDFDVCDELMVPDYTLHMGTASLSGRDEYYKPATMKQFDQFPGLCLTVNELLTNGDRMLLHFSEHGASVRHGGARAAWSGIGLYKWDGQRLVENFVEQDYFSRREQLKSGSPNPVERPAIAPWDTEPIAANPEAEQALLGFFASGDLTIIDDVVFDDAWTNNTRQQVLSADGISVNDMFSAGDRVAFHITQTGQLLGDYSVGDAELKHHLGRDVELHMAGYVTVLDGAVVAGRVIRDRLGLYRRLTR